MVPNTEGGMVRVIPPSVCRTLVVHQGVESDMDPAVSAVCCACGAPVPDGGVCRDNLDALLAIEAQIPGGPGMIAHFHAVAAYGLQHPDSMNYTERTLSNLRDALADQLDGRATIDTVRRRTRYAAEGSTRVTRRSGESTVAWYRGTWPMTVADVLTVDRTAEAYAECVAAWARSVRVTLDVSSKSPRY
jgi:hypothetical protein